MVVRSVLGCDNVNGMSIFKHQAQQKGGVQLLPNDALACCTTQHTKNTHTHSSLSSSVFHSSTHTHLSPSLCRTLSFPLSSSRNIKVYPHTLISLFRTLFLSLPLSMSLSFSLSF